VSCRPPARAVDPRVPSRSAAESSGTPGRLLAAALDLGSGRRPGRRAAPPPHPQTRSASRPVWRGRRVAATACPVPLRRGTPPAPPTGRPGSPAAPAPTEVSTAASWPVCARPGVVEGRSGASRASRLLLREPDVRVAYPTGIGQSVVLGGLLLRQRRIAPAFDFLLQVIGPHRHARRQVDHRSPELG
jgi:hypothetical protein